MRTVIVAILLLVDICAEAQVAAVIGTGISHRALIRKPQYHNHPITPLLFETFDAASGYDMVGWLEQETAPGEVNPDYTATILHGTQSLLIDQNADDNPNYTTNSFAARSRVFIFFKIRPLALNTGTDSTVLKLLNTVGDCQLRITLNGDGDFKVWPTCDTSCQTAFGLSINTTYNVWVEYNKDDGVNAFASLTYSTGLIMPTGGDQFTSCTFTPDTEDVSRVLIGADLGTDDVDFVFDYLLITDVQITSFP